MLESINLLLSYVQEISTFNASQFRAQWDFLQYHEVEDYQNYIRNSAYPHKAIIQYAYFMFYNGSNNYLDIVSQLDSQFMDYMLTTVMNLYNRNVIICVVCFVTSYIVT